MKRYKIGKIKIISPGLNVLLILTFLFGIIIIIGMTGCASSEKDILADMEADPNNPQVIADAAKFYYKKNDYNEAYKFYKKLEEQKSIDDSQKYRMHVSGTRDTSVNKKCWKKIYTLRNSKTIKYTKIDFDDTVKLSIPEHWIVIDKEAEQDGFLKDASDLLNNHEDLLGIKDTPIKTKKTKGQKKEQKKDKKKKTEADTLKEIAPITGGRHIYGGPGFIMRLDGICGFSVPTEAEEIRTTYYYGTSYTDESIHTKVVGGVNRINLLKRLLNFNSMYGSYSEEKEPEFYIYKILSKGKVGPKTKYKYKKTKYDIQADKDYSHKDDLLINYIYWTDKFINKVDPSTGYILWAQKSEQDDKYISIIFFKLKSYHGYGIKIAACLKEENKEVYLKELEKFILD